MLTDWLLTYLLHSTLLLVVAILVRAALRERRLALQEVVLRTALLGGFVTAAVQVGLGTKPAFGRIELGPVQAVSAVADVPAFVEDSEEAPPVRFARPAPGL